MIDVKGAVVRALAFAGVPLFGCAEPSFVSLGSNISAVSGEDDAGASVYADGDAAASTTVEPGDLPNFNPPDLNADPFDIEAIDPCVPAGESVAVATDCAGRALVQCPGPTTEYPDPLVGTLSRLLATCGGSNVVVRVRFAEGCATSFDLSVVGTPDLVSPCVAQSLSSQRYDCAASVACGAGKHFSVLTN